MVGVSQRPDNLASNIVLNLQRWGFEGQVLPVGRSGGTVHGLRVLRSVEQLPRGVDLACVLTPAASVPGLVSQLGDRGVRAVNIQSSGFSELSAGGRQLSQLLLAAARARQVRIIGPNCIGTMDARHRLSTPFSVMQPMDPGPVTVISQSGGVLFSYLRDLLDESLGLARAVSFGNKLDVDEADLLRHLAHHPHTRVIGLYLEDIRAGRALMEAAAACPKPVVLHKSNRGPLSHGIAASHTASLMSDHAVVCSAAQQAGIVTVDSTSEALNAYKALLMPPLRGRRIAVVSRSGGHAVIAADCCQRHGFELPPFPEELLADLRRHVRAGVTRMGNPLDLGDLWEMQTYEQILERVAALDGIDGLVFLFVAISGVEQGVFVQLTERVARVARRVGKPVAFCFMSWRDNLRQVCQQAQRRLDPQYPVFADVEQAVDALGLLWRHGVGGARPRRAGAPALTVSQSAESPGGTAADVLARPPLTLPACLELLERYQVPMVPTRVGPAAHAVALAAELGFPVALKLLSPQIVHKTDAGAVRLGLATADEVSRACEQMARRAAELGATLEGFALQPMVSGGLELIVGIRRDPAFGPVVLVGLGGTLVEVLADVVLRVAPVEPPGALQMLEQLAGAPLLRGARGAAPADRQALAELIAAVSRLAVAEPTIEELELNPVLVQQQGRGCLALDVRAKERPGPGPSRSALAPRT